VSNSCSICLCERLDSADKIKVTLQTYVCHLLVLSNEANRSHRCSQGRLRIFRMSYHFVLREAVTQNKMLFLT